MAYNESLADRIREALTYQPDVEEKKMMGGLCFMVNGKMCLGIVKDELMCRLSPEIYEQVLERPGCREMDFTGKPMKGFVFVDGEGMKTAKDFNFWVERALEYNKKTKPSARRKKKT